MIHRLALALAFCLALPVVASAQSPGAQSTSDHFRIESETVQGKGGKPVVRGYVYNLYGAHALMLQILIEGLDAAGRPVSNAAQWVIGGVPAGGRRWFETAAPAPGETFRVSVLSWTWAR